MMQEIAVCVKSLTKRFGQFIAVDNVSFEIKKGEIFAFLGSNGAGKSTTIKMLCGLLKPTESQGTVAGFDIMTQSEEIKASIGYMSQKFSLYSDLTVDENMDFFGGIYSVRKKDLALKKEELSERLGLTDKRYDLAKLLTGGNRQRLSLACSLLHSPKIIFLDEPTSGADPVARRDFWDIIRNLSSEGVTIFVTTHYMEEAEYCNRIVLISAGKIVAQGSPPDLKSSFKYDIFYVECSDTLKAAKILKQDEHFVDVYSKKSGLGCVMVKGLDNEQILKEIFEKSSIATKTIKNERITLEDVFLYSAG